MPLKQGDVVLDRTTKDIVKLTNFKCCFDHATPEAFRAAHGGDGKTECQFTVPFEGQVVRFVGLNATGEPILAWAYVNVEGHALSVLTYPSTSEELEAVLSQPISDRWKGRI